MDIPQLMEHNYKRIILFENNIFKQHTFSQNKTIKKHFAVSIDTEHRFVSDTQTCLRSVLVNCQFFGACT